MPSAERPVDDKDRLALEYLSRELETNETRIYDHIATTFRWVMGTLFAANGGAIVALLSRPSHLTGELYSLAWFAAGTILSLLVGILSAFMGLRVIAPLITARAKVHQALITGDIGDTQNALSELAKKQKMDWKSWSPTYAGLASLACFVIGVVTMACSLV